MKVNSFGAGNIQSPSTQSTNTQSTKAAFQAESFERILSQREKAYLDRSFNNNKPQTQNKPKPREFLGKYIDIKA